MHTATAHSKLATNKLHDVGAGDAGGERDGVHQHERRAPVIRPKCTLP